MKRTIALVLAAFIPATAASADPVCMLAAEMEAALIDWYAEAPVEGAWVDAQQLWASEATGTWTLMELNGDGTACVLSQGDNWQAGDDALIALGRSLESQDGGSASAIAFLDMLQADAS
ncbi:S-adenosyl-L-homocysteine hydrolase [uncultured Tateyamaria sp.]|uniref:S-adenosyl-L-homocysteine hydrolase n=1 Tax=uncultured Tateyamaria sp. TaxID=455651 RepID=UPI002622BBA9|nr:S-adenosyl-L-homocysteine hydrolase [uncultured Tateyamaria sp.]